MRTDGTSTVLKSKRLGVLQEEGEEGEEGEEEEVEDPHQLVAPQQVEQCQPEQVWKEEDQPLHRQEPRH